MSLAPRLDIRQSQSLVMTPQLQQAIKLLALSNLEIEGFIAEEVERNPLLEASAAEDSDAPDREPAPEVRDERVAADELVAGTGSGDEPTLDVDYATESHQQDSVADGGSGMDGALSMTARARGERAARTAPIWTRSPTPASASPIICSRRPARQSRTKTRSLPRI